MVNDDSLNLETETPRTLGIERARMYSELSRITSNADHILLLFKVKSGVPASMIESIKDSIETFSERITRLDGRPVHWYFYNEDMMEVEVVDLRHQEVRGIDG